MGHQLIACLLLTQSASLVGGDPDPAMLVARLGSPQYAERQAAGEALARLGRAALPALAKASGESDLEVRLRAESLIVRIEANDLLNATPVAVAAHDRPLAEAIAALEQASGMRIRPGPNHGPGTPKPPWPDRRVTLDTAGPVPFWEALDALGRAGGLQREFPKGEAQGFRFGPNFSLDLVSGRAQPPKSDTGSLRVEVLHVRHRRDRDYGVADSEFRANFGRQAAQPGASISPTESSSYSAHLLVSAEPRLMIFGAGEVQNLKVVDDRGRSLLKSPNDPAAVEREQMLQNNPHLDPRTNPDIRYGSGGRMASATVDVAVALSYPSPPARRIALVRGAVPLLVLGRRPDPLLFDLKGSSGQAFSKGSTTVTIHKIEDEGNRPPTVELTVDTGQPGDGTTMMVSDAKGVRHTVRAPSDPLHLSLEVIDAQGEPVSWQFTASPSRRSQGRMTIVFQQFRGGKWQRLDGLRLRCWELVGAVTDLPFEFHDIPTP